MADVRSPEVSFEAGGGLPMPDFSHLSSRSTPEDMLRYGEFLSQLHALPDGSPIPPTVGILKEARRNNYGPSANAVRIVMGSFANFQRMLGWATTAVTNEWTDEEMLENGRWLTHVAGTPEEPKILSWADHDKASGLFIGPSLDLIKRRFGTIDKYRDAMGYISNATLDRWTDQDWIDNGVWLSHMLGSPEEPQMPTQKAIKRASKSGIAPPLGQIEERYVSLQAYQEALGFENKWHKKLDYPNWDRETYLENGTWFSHALGSAEHPKMPSERDLEAGSALDLCPPPSAIFKRFGRTITTYQDQLGFVTPATLARWTEQDWIDNGVWLSHMLGSPEEPRAPRGHQDIELASAVHITPPIKKILERYGSLTAYHEALGLAGPNANRHTTNREVLAQGLELVQKYGRPLTRVEYKHEGVSLGLMQRRFGGTTNFNALLGYPDYSTYGQDELIAFGIRWTIQHGGKPITPATMRALSTRHQGPSHKRIRTEFNGYANYNAAIAEALPKYHELRKQMLFELDNSERVADHLLHDFRPDGEYAEDRIIMARDLLTLLRGDKVPIAQLYENFAKSRLTLLWDRADYLDFGQKAFGRNNLTHKKCKAKLALLDRARMTPHLIVIIDIFGSEEAFIEEVIGEQVQEEAA